ncbi:MAG: histidinol dehydrogenase, partial [Pseudomonadota bacterium]
MPHRLQAGQPDFVTELDRLLTARQGDDPAATDAARAIVADVRARGDAAVIELTNRFDRLSLKTGDDLRLPASRIREAAAQCPQDVKDALAFAA